MKYNDLINELLSLLDNNDDIKHIKTLKESLKNNQEFLKKIDNYHQNPTSLNKQELYDNLDYVNYLKSETNIIFLLEDIKSSFKVLKGKMSCK